MLASSIIQACFYKDCGGYWPTLNTTNPQFHIYMSCFYKAMPRPQRWILSCLEDLHCMHLWNYTQLDHLFHLPVHLSCYADIVESRNPHISIQFLDNDPRHSCHHFERTHMSKFSVNYLTLYDIAIETFYAYIIFQILSIFIKKLTKSKIIQSKFKCIK